jgi:nitric oxide reductase activation protein
MIDKTKIIDTVCERLKKLPLGHYLDLKTYKRNRSLIIAKTDEQDLLVIENGYFQDLGLGSVS